MSENNIPEFERMAAQLLRDAVTYVEVSGLNFFKDRFYQGGWHSNVFEPWTPLKNGRDGILQKTGNLRESIRVLEATPLRVVFGTSAIQAEIHNNGGTLQVRVTPKSRKYFWYMYKVTKKSMWKAMAMTKKTHLLIKIPKRQFIGESQHYMQQLDTWIAERIQTTIKKL